MDNWEWAEGYYTGARFGLFRIDRDETDANGISPLRRRITEGAMAFSYLAHTNGLGTSLERFGTISSHGDEVLPPSKTPWAVYEGSIDGDAAERMTLAFSRPRPDALIGMLYLHGTDVWCPLSDVLYQAGALTFRATLHDEAWTFSGAPLVAGIEGVCQRRGRTDSWRAARVPFCGTWGSTGADRDFLLHISRLEGRFAGRVYGSALSRARAIPESGWRALASFIETEPPHTLRFVEPNVDSFGRSAGRDIAYEARLTSPGEMTVSMSGSIVRRRGVRGPARLVNITRTVTLIRLTDEVPLS